MATTVDRYVGDNGDVLIPLNQNATNSASMVSAKTGVYYMAQTTVTAGGTEGTPMGLLLALTYSA